MADTPRNTPSSEERAGPHDGPRPDPVLSALATYKDVHKDAPEKIGKYSIKKRIGSGGMGDVWQAEDPFGNCVAIKLIGSAGGNPTRHLKRFIREAHTLATLQHRNICKIFGIEEVNDKPYIVMEYVQGVSLNKVLRHLADSTTDDDVGTTAEIKSELGTLIDDVEKNLTFSQSIIPTEKEEHTVTAVLPVRQALSIVIKLCHAVQYAHECSVLHRDIKPSNIILRRDGEPVLLDFGVAKILSEPTDGEESTATGQLFGTIDYMAPEQARSSRDVDERADVYSIGAILYQMVTGRKHFNPSGLVIKDVQRLRYYEPIPPRSWRRQIDRDLDAIILKSLASDRHRRYRTARELAQDLERYQQGLPVAVTRPGVFSKAIKFVRRHRVPVAFIAVILVMGLAFGGYYAFDYYLRWGNWVQTFHQDFTHRTYDTDRFLFWNANGSAEAPWEADSVGLRMEKNHWCWLRDLKISGNVRLVVRAQYDDLPDGLDLVINAQQNPRDPWYTVPRGYSAQVGGYQGTLDFISINPRAEVASSINPVASRAVTGRMQTIMFQREEDRITLFVDGKKQSEIRDPAPLYSPDLSRIALRCWVTELHIKSIDVYHLSLPQRSTPLVAGDALATAGLHREALSTYFNIAYDYPYSLLAEKALTRSLISAFRLSDTLNRQAIDSVVDVYDAMFSRGRSRQGFRETLITEYWRCGSFAEALRLMPTHFRDYPRTELASMLLNLTLTWGVPSAIKHEVVAWAAKERAPTYLNLAFTDPSSIEKIRGLHLTHLQVGHDTITSLDALRGMRLRWLYADGNPLADLSPLAGQPIELLACQTDRIESLAPLKGMPLRILDIDSNLVADLSPLEGSPIRHLRAGSNRLTTLEPLRHMQVTHLRIAANQVTDLSPIGSLKLRWLDCDANRIVSLAPLAAMPIGVLSCANNRIESLEDLRRVPLLDLDCRGNKITTLAPLAGKHLRLLDCRSNPLKSLQPFVAEPPPSDFRFYTATLSVPAIDSAITVWQRNPGLEPLVRRAILLRCLVSRNFRGLKEIAEKQPDNSYRLRIEWSDPPYPPDSIARWSGAKAEHLERLAESRIESYFTLRWNP